MGQAALHLRSGAIATIDNSRKAVYGYDQHVEILGAILENRPTALCGIDGRMTAVMRPRESYDEWRPVTLEEIAA